MRSLRDPPSTASEILDRDETLLRDGAPVVRVTVIRETSVSFGVGTPRDGSAEANARRLGLPIVRRSTGGSGILHLPGDLVWSVVLPRSDPMVGPDFSSAYGRLGAGLVLFLADLGLDGRWSDPTALSDEFCLLGRRGRVLTVHGKAIGGAAQHVTSTALLHHGVVGVTVDRLLVERVFGVARSVTTERVTSLAELGISTEPEALADALARAVAASLGGPRAP